MGHRYIRPALLLGALAATSGCGGSGIPSDPAGVPEAREEVAFSGPRTVNQDLSGMYLSPEESLATFRLPTGYRLELVASEPMIREPVAIAWDGNGRMYVAQMETFMQSIDPGGQHEPTSRVMRLEDTDGDGRMDRSTTFVDGLVLPRMLLTVGDELLLGETNSYDIHAYRDSDGDGVADQKRVAYRSEKPFSYANLEHQRSGLDWNLDNWIYITMDPVRFRYREGVLQVDTVPTGVNGQWGLTHDDYGRLFFSRAASGVPASGFQINPAYGQLELPDAYDPSFLEVRPITATPDIFGGKGSLRPEDGTMTRFTAAGGQSIFRGDRAPRTLVGDYLVTEPVGRLIRRASVVSRQGQIFLENVYADEEFVASTDMNFRPVNTATGPDGTLYIVDMHRGIIQEGSWVEPGSYLHGQIQRFGLDRNVGRGRIYRLVHEAIEPGPMPRMLDEPTHQLLAHLDHPNGWWRDNAQREIIVRGDQSVVPELKRMVLGEGGAQGRSPSALGRIHALWTLEGLSSIDAPTLLRAMDDGDASVRKTAVWVSEPLVRANDPAILAKLESLATDSDFDVLVQLVLTLSTRGEGPGAAAIARNVWAKHPTSPMLRGIQATLARNEEARKFGARLMELDPSARARVLEGATIYGSLCSACHGSQGEGTQTAPPLLGNVRLAFNRDAAIKVLLHGLASPSGDGTSGESMPAMGASSDQWIAAVLSYVRLNLSQAGFPGGFERNADVTPEQVRAVRDRFAGRSRPWTWEELTGK